MRTGEKSESDNVFGSKETIVEAFKYEKINDDINPFGDIKDRFKNNNILKFY